MLCSTAPKSCFLTDDFTILLFQRCAQEHKTRKIRRKPAKTNPAALPQLRLTIVWAIRGLTWMWPSQGAEQSSILIGSIKQLHWVVHCCLENSKLTKHHWRKRNKHRYKLAFVLVFQSQHPLYAYMVCVITSVLTKLWGHSDVVGAGLSSSVV